MNQSELYEAIAKHAKWLRREAGGARADLSGADLHGASLYDVDLCGANLSDADLHEADLRVVSMKGAYARGVDLHGACLYRADLRGACLSNATLRGANLCWAELAEADLYKADLRYANLTGANLCNAQLDKAQLDGILLPIAEIPQGEIEGWKKCRDGVIVHLRIPAEAKRSASTSNKLRAEYAEVIETIGASFGVSCYNVAVVYRAGETVHSDEWDANRWNECSHGIHFFMTRKEAKADPIW